MSSRSKAANGSQSSPTRQYEVLESLDSDSTGPGIQKQDVGRLESCLATRGPQPELTVILAFLLRRAMQDRRGLAHHYLSHLYSLPSIIWHRQSKIRELFSQAANAG